MPDTYFNPWVESTSRVKLLVLGYNVTAIATEHARTRSYRVRTGRRYQMRQQQYKA